MVRKDESRGQTANEAALRKRGGVTIWLEQDAITAERWHRHGDPIQRALIECENEVDSRQQNLPLHYDLEVAF